MEGRVALPEVTDQAPFGRLQTVLLVLTTLVIMLDGYDAVSIGYAAPGLAAALGVPVGAFGPVFGAGLLGLLLGSLVMGPLADRFGRKGLMLTAILIFGTFTLLPVFDLSFGRLLAYRFITGLGLGGAMPCAIALTKEYLPRRRGALLLNLMLAGFPLGAVVGGLISSALVGRFGWPVIFVIGGVLPLLLLPVLAVWLPESLGFLLVQPSRRAAALRALRRVDPARGWTPEQIAAPAPLPGLLHSVGGLFARPRMAGTMLLWLANFCCLFILFFINNWLPALMTGAGISLGRAILGPVVMNLGGVVGGIALGPLIARYGPYRPLGVGMLAGAGCVALLGQHIADVASTLGVAFAAGLFVDGVQLSLNAVAARFYPAEIRTTGIAWALAVGRIGSVLGPVSGGILLASHWSPGGMFVGAAVPALACAAALFVLGQRYREVGHTAAPVARVA